MTLHEQLLKDMARASCETDGYNPDMWDLSLLPDHRNWEYYIPSSRAALAVVRGALAVVTPTQQEAAIGFLNRPDQMIAVAAFGDLLRASAITPDKTGSAK